jgi:Protein of unknown function DUF262
MDRVDYESLIIADLLRFHADGTLDINPWYQRRSVWSEPQRAYLINTVFERKPVPSVYIRQIIDLEREKGVKEVVDGQQRLRSIIDFRQDEFAARHPNHAKKILFSDLARREQTHFLETKLSVGYLIGAEDSDVIEIFGRINSISKTLNPQEKRNARYSGDFKQFSLRQAAIRLPFWRSAHIFSANDIARMQEVQFVSDVAINLIEGLTDFSAGRIDRYYKLYDESFEHEEKLADRFERIFACLVSIDPSTYHDTLFSVPQILLSLMIAMDSTGHFLSGEQLGVCLLEIDRHIRGYQGLEELTAEQSNELSGFTGGNLHRIRARRIRSDVICRELEKHGSAAERLRLVLSPVE